MATNTYADTAIQTCVFTAFSDCPQNDFILRCCLIHLKNNSIFQRCLYSCAISVALRLKLFVRNINIFPVSASLNFIRFLTVWTGTSNPASVRQQLAETFGVAQDRVRVLVPHFGGGFGGKHTAEAATEAAHLAKQAGRPVAVQWTRAEEFTWAYFRPAALIEIEAGLDAGKAISAWDFTNYNSGASGLDTP